MTQTTSLREETIINKTKSQFPQYVKEAKIDSDRHVRNVHIADMPIIYGSLDYWPVEADR